MRKQILVVLAMVTTLVSVTPSYAAVIEAGKGKKVQQEETKSEEASTAQETTESTTQEQSSDGINWIVPKDTSVADLNKTYGTTQWWKAESAEQAKKWAEDHKGSIAEIADEKARYEAVAKEVCDFLTYDDMYFDPHIAYTIRDGRGVCADYTTLGKALCDGVGITADISVGYVSGAILRHDMLKVTLNEQTYYSDLSNYDVGSASMLSTSPYSYYTEDQVEHNLIDAAGLTGAVTDPKSIAVQSMQVNTTNEMVVSANATGYWYGTMEDCVALNEAVENNDAAAQQAILERLRFVAK